MRSIYYSIALVLSLSVLGVVIKAQGTSALSDKAKSKANSLVVVTYDKSKDLTTVRVKQFTITTLKQEKQLAPNVPLHQMDLEIWFTYPGQTAKTTDHDVHFRFHATASNYVFLSKQQITAALDREIKGQDRAFSLGTTDYKSYPPKFNSVYEENMVVKVPSDGVLKLAMAKTLELFVGPVGYVLSEKQIGAIRELAAIVSEPLK
jgi:hypothetical protein